MEKMIMTKHAGDRMDRLMFIAQYVEGGFGETYYQSYNPETDRYEVLTTTGVIIIRAVDTPTLITAYPASLDKVIAMFKARNPYFSVPEWLRNRISKNEKMRRKMGVK